MSQTTNYSISSKSFSFIVLDLNNKINMVEMLQFFDSNYYDYEIIYCSSKSIQPSFRVKNLTFNNNENSETVLNSVVGLCKKNNIVVVREITSFEDIKHLTNSLMLSNQVVYFNRKQSKIKKIFCNLLVKIINLLFFKDFVITNSSCVAYGEIASNILKKLEYPSNLMRANRWQGIQLVGIDGGKKCEYKYNITKIALLTFVPLFLGIMLVTLACVLHKISSMVKMVMWLGVLISFALSGIFAINWFIKNEIGENNLEKINIEGSENYEEN